MSSRRLFYTSAREFYPSSTVRVFKARNQKTKPITTTETATKATPNDISVKEEKKENFTGAKNHTKTLAHREVEEFAENCVHIQMLSRNLHEQLFPQCSRAQQTIEPSKAESFLKELRLHGIDASTTERLADVKLQLPPLQGKNIEEHFFNIAKEQIAPYEALLQPLIEMTKLPTPPKKWSYTSGWTVYDAETGVGTPIDFPNEHGLVFDIEVCVGDGAAPVLATAVGPQRWYSWVSRRLIEKTESQKHAKNAQPRYVLDDLIPLGTTAAKLIVGHNVSYDRARLREPYLLEDTAIRFLDTMSLHVCVSGLTSYQRAMLKSKGEAAPEDEDWRRQSSLNNLVDVHQLYCGGAEPLSKEARNIFVEGTLNDVRLNFQSLMSYCAGDVEATAAVLRVLYPLFRERFPHPVTLAGMLEIGSAYLPVNSNWLRYIRESDLAYEDLSIEAKYHLTRQAENACTLHNEAKYRENLWLWDEDWSVQTLKLKKPTTVRIKSKANTQESTTKENHDDQPSDNEQRLRNKFQYLHRMRSQLPARRPLLPGYPAWYRKLCLKPPTSTALSSTDWTPSASQISTGMQIAPKLLALCWEGYPLHHTKEHGWGFLVPFRNDHPADVQGKIPIEQLVQRCPVPEFARGAATSTESDYAFDTLQTELDVKLAKREFYNKIKANPSNNVYKGSGVWCNVVLEGCCHFIKLPHKNGASHRVGNPLSRDFLNKFSENVLSTGIETDESGELASRVIEIARMMSYWRNNRDRILGQIVIWQPNDELVDDSLEYGAICPIVVTCGTLTRRAMEPTWLTASNSQRERIGSELRAMVQAPPGYRIVGADVDSQELWIASVLGDAYAGGVHGATPLGWMTLSGSKSHGTDMHSVTAKAVGISRDHAKVINYARIYGAGQNFAEGLLKQFNPTFSATEAKQKAMKMFAITKGKRIYKLKPEFAEEFGNEYVSKYEATILAKARQCNILELFDRPGWLGGTESAMFNRLEEIAMSRQPVTPFLNCRLSRALEMEDETANRFLPTRVNWVVQSGAVDFLHLMLVSMRWLMKSHVRFCLSFHDEVRYLVKEEMAYKAALAMHVTNLMTRSFCASRIGLHDLPMSVAFFSSVEVDRVLRKESTMDCKTPSNPHGLRIGYGIPPGESLNIYETLEKADIREGKQWWIK